ncbi:MAG: adenosylcobinamide-phosphate synthase CbiB [Bacillota bacterium]|jgi:adenosylcobinamide-phosphate synthase
MISIWLALLSDLLLGDPKWFPHPVRLIGKYIAAFERQVRRWRFNPAGLRISGICLTVTTVGLAWFIVWGILTWCARVNWWLYQVVNIGFLWTCLAPRCLAREAAQIARTLRDGEIGLARCQLAMIVGRDTENLDESGIIRAVVETVAENTSDGVIAPLFYMFLGGAPLAMAYKAVNTLDSTVGYKKAFYRYFGWCAAKCDDAANFVPARLTAALLWLAAWFLRLDYRNCARIIRRDRHNHLSPNAAYPEAAVAGALGVRLGGANYYFGELTPKPTLGDPLAPLQIEHIRATNRLMYGATFLALGLFSGFLGWWRGWW